MESCPQITSENYVENVLRTDCDINFDLISRIARPETIRLIHAAMGMVTESAELMDMLKKHIFYGKPMDLVNAKEEVGDNQWYVGLAVDVMRTTMNDVMTVNINKLKLRYPEKFTEHNATNRNVAIERQFLEDANKAFATDKGILTGEGEVPAISKRGEDWLNFSNKVFAHIENYTVPQYGDKGEDQASEWSIEMLIEQTKKYANRYGRNSREGQEIMDFMKACHYLQIAATLFENETE